jgi:hypothetical protein
MTLVASLNSETAMAKASDPTPNAGKGKRRTPLLDTVLVRSIIWLTLAIGLAGPVAAPLFFTAATPNLPRSAPHAASPGARDIDLAPGRLDAILGVNRPGSNPDNAPATGPEAAAVLQWCAQRIAGHEHVSPDEARRTLSAALLEPASAAGVRVINALEAPSLDAGGEARRLQCAAMLDDVLQH